jgi:hypothetical protein
VHEAHVLTVAVQVESAWHARSSSQHFCAAHWVHDALEEVVHCEADPLLETPSLDPALDPEPWVVPGPLLDTD